jgi:UDP-GlcNAc:undecaprenyl-phosphate GlcNAc-1-phosphate transferase
MGDAGSQFLGHYLAVGALLLIDSSRTGYSPLLALFIWGVPLLDTIGVMSQRLAEGRSPFVGDRNHLHYKLLGTGISHRQAVTLLYTAHGLMVCSAYLLRWQSDFILLAVYALFACPILSLFVGGVDGRFFLGRGAENDAAPDRGPTGEDGWLSALPVKLLGLAVPVFLVASVFLPAHVPRDMGLVAIALCLLVAAGLTVMPTAAPLLVRTGLYVGATVVIYLMEQPGPGSLSNIHALLNFFFLALAILIMLGIRFGVKHRFETTPLDYLMMFLAFTIPFLPEMWIGDINLSLLTAKLIVMFLAFELLLHALAERLRQFGLVSLWMLCLLGLRAWW